MKMQTLLVSALALSSITACASTEAGEREPRGIAAYANDPRLGEQVNKICFAHSIDGFNGLDERTVILSDGPRKKYIAETFGPCHDLDYAWEIALSSHSSCLRDNDKLIITRGAGVPNSDPITRTCYIKNIYKWDPKAGENEGDATIEGS